MSFTSIWWSGHFLENLWAAIIFTKTSGQFGPQITKLMAILKSCIPQGQGMSWHQSGVTLGWKFLMCLVRLRHSQACEKTLTSATFLSFRFLEATYALCPGSFLEQLASLRGHELPKLVDFHILHLHQSSQEPLQSVWAQLECSCKSFQRSRKSFKPHRKWWQINLKLACFL